METKKEGLIYSAIPKVMSAIDAIAKTRISGAGGGNTFKFRGIDDIYNELQKKMADEGVFSTTTILGRHREEVVSNKGHKGYLSIINYRFRFYAKDGSFVESDADGEAIDYGDKSTSKTASIAHKYALLMTFMIPTVDKEGEEKDPDYNQHELKPEEKKTQADSTASKPLVKPNDTSEKKNAFTGLSKNQRDLLKNMADERGLTNEEMSAFIKKHTGKDKSTEVSPTQFDVLIAMLKGIKPKPVPTEGEDNSWADEQSMYVK